MFRQLLVLWRDRYDAATIAERVKVTSMLGALLDLRPLLAGVIRGAGLKSMLLLPQLLLLITVAPNGAFTQAAPVLHYH